jgi:hypothetical protein
MANAQRTSTPSQIVAAVEYGRKPSGRISATSVGGWGIGFGSAFSTAAGR